MRVHKRGKSGPVGAVEGAVLHRLGQVFGADALGAFQVGNRPRHLEDAVVRPRAQAQPGDGGLDVTGDFCTSGNERESTKEDRWYVDQEVQTGTDRNAAAAD